MPDLEISNLPALAEAGIAATDPLAIADLSASETKKVTVKDLIEAGVALIDAGSIPSAKVAALGTNQVETGSIIDGAVTNVKLANSSVSLGGISISLGGTDATPAFNLTDATNYPTSSLSGTITNAQLAGSIANSKLANSSVSFGGISLALGGTDATPAFNLTDATGYKTTELVGTITNAQLAGSIDVSKLTGSAVSLGGVSVALGGTDATPAFNLTDATGYPTSSLVGTITNAQLAGSIANAKLANSSVSLGGVSIALGGTDATPAFNLADATGYPTSSLVGTITNAQLAGSIDVSKLAGTTAISLGGVSISLGGTDATPAFDLTDATNYPAASLTGTISNAQLAGSIANAKLVNSSVSLGGVTVALGASDATPAFDLTDATNYPTSSLTGTITNAQLAGSIAVSKLVSSSASIGGVTITLGATDATPAFDLQDATGYPTTALVGTITNAQLAGSIAATKLVAGSITSTQLGANSVTDSELANNAVDTGAVQNGAITNDKVETSTSATTGLDAATKIRDATITPAKLNTSNLDRSLNVASGNLGINNTITAATRSGISYNAQGLITGTVALAAADLPVATSSAVGGVSVSTGLTVNGSGALSLTNSVTGATVSGITFNNQGMITAATALVAGDLPTATTSAKGAVQITSGGGLTVDGSGNLTTSTSGISAGTYQSITVNNKGVATAGAALTAALIPSLAASKITSGSFDAARIANDSIDGSKLSNASTAIFQSVAQSGYPTAQFSGQILFDTVSEDAWIWDGNAWQAITTLTKGSLVFGGNFNANTSKMTACTSAGLAAGLAVGSNLPTPSATTDGLYVVVDTAGTPSAPAPVVAFSPPDYILGVTNASGSSWNEIDLSQTVAGQVASNITFTPYGQISSTNVQDALQELETEKLAKSGGTITGEILISNTGSLVFEGSTVDAFETTLTVADPTSSDKTITFPDTTGTVITSGDTNTVTSTMVDASLVNANLAAGAAIAFSKLAALTSAQILVGNGSNVVTGVAVTGDISINNAGLTSITAGAIVNADINASAAIAGSKITTGTTSAVGVLQLTDSATSTSATTAATPAAVKIAKDAADAAATTANAALPKAGGTLTDNLLVDNDKEVRFFEADSNGTAYVGIKGATDKASSGSYTISLPAAPPNTGQVLKAGSTATTLEWATDISNTAAADLTGTTLASGVTASSLTSVGTLANLTVTNTITGSVSGSAATVTGAAQSAITSLGTLTGLTVDGDVTIADKIIHNGDTDTAIRFPAVDTFAIETGGSERVRVDSTGRLLLNTSSPVTTDGGASIPSIQVATPDGGNLILARNDTTVAAGENLGAIRWYGNDANGTYELAAQIEAEADLTHDTGDKPSRLCFSTTKDGAAISTERFRIDNAGRCIIGGGSHSSDSILVVKGDGDVGTNSAVASFFWAGAASAANTELAQLRFGATNNSSGNAQIRVKTDGAWGSGDYPTAMLFETTPDGSSTMTTALTLDSSQNATFAGDVTFTGDSSNGLWDKSASAFVADLTGTASIATSITVADESTDTTCNVLFATGATGNLGAKSRSTFTFNAANGRLTAPSFGGAFIGNADTATKLYSAKNIGGVSFDGTAAIDLPGVNTAGTQDTSGTAALATEFTVTANNSTDETVYPLFADGATGSQGAETDTGLTYNPSTGLLTSTGFAGSLTGTIQTAAQANITSLGTLTALTIDGSYKQVSEAVSALDIDVSTGNYFTKTINGASTFTFSNPATSGTVSAFTLELTHTSGTITWPTSVVWNGGVGKTAPTVATGKTHLFMFVTDDAGTTYRGAVLADYDNAA